MFTDISYADGNVLGAYVANLPDELIEVLASLAVTHRVDGKSETPLIPSS